MINLKYAIKYIFKNPSKSFILLSIATLMTFTIFSVFLINDTYQTIIDTSNDKIAYEVNIKGKNFSGGMEEMVFSSHDPGYGAQLQAGLDILNNLASLPGVKSFTYNPALMAYHHNLSVNLSNSVYQSFFPFEDHATIIEYNDKPLAQTKYRIFAFGIDENYLTEHNIELLAGSNFSVDDIANGTRKVIVNENACYDVDGEAVPFKVGDTLTLDVPTLLDVDAAYNYEQWHYFQGYQPYYEKTIEYEVVGIYKSREVNVIDQLGDDYNLNSRFYFPSAAIFKYLSEMFNTLPNVPGHHILSFNFDDEYCPMNFAFFNPTYIVDNLDNTLELIQEANNQFWQYQSRYDYNTVVGEFNSKEAEIEPLSNIEAITNILKPIESLKDSLFNISLVIVSFLFLIYCGVLIMYIHPRFKEMGILKSLGKSNGNIFIQLFYENAMVNVIGLLLGTVLTFLITIPFVQKFLELSIHQQNEMVRLSNNTNAIQSIMLDMDAVSLTLSNQSLLFGCLFTFVVSALTTLGVFIYTLKVNPKDFLMKANN